MVKGRKRVSQSEEGLLPPRTPAISRREVLTGITCAGLGMAMSALVARGRPAPTEPQGGSHDRTEAASPKAQAPQNPPAQSDALTSDDLRLLEEIQRASFLYFWEQADPLTGLVRDRFNVRAAADPRSAASIAATGFGLTAICIGAERHYVDAAEARDRVLNTLRFLHSNMPTHRGFYYHWANVHTGTRIWDSEISSIDTAILLCGVITCREYFRHREITRLATEIFDRVEWTWLSADTSLLPHGLTLYAGALQTASLDHAMWFHRPFRADEWLLYVQDSPSASGARGFNRGAIFRRDGVLVASVAQEGLIRVRHGAAERDSTG